GFLVNRVLAPFLAQAAALLAEGLSIPEIDHIATDEGMPMGPFVLLDEVGLDVASAVSAVLVAGLGDRFATGDLLERLKKAGRLGKKNGAGFYRWPKRTLDRELPDLLGIAWAASPRGPKSASLAPTAGDRLMRAIADEASRALAEGVAASADDVDLACIAGIGYPPFRGGPLRDRARAAARP
ncbi:MAG TPA: 3-hydroxyacyl-CoA dehydrogenase family protein, partial [Planctomycetota bacterium]|nr:3-hydroxyacyl-CoA dehydrogenase family protein [Planctomycetota bacterium]